MSYQGPKNVTIINGIAEVIIGDGLEGTVALDAVHFSDTNIGVVLITGHKAADGLLGAIILGANLPPGSINFGGAVADAGPLIFRLLSASDSNNVSVIWHYEKL